MADNRNPFQVMNIVLGSFGVAFTIPYIIYRIVKTMFMKRSYAEFAGKVVVITGASSGLGEALAHEFYKLGCIVVLCARRREELERVRKDLLQMHSTLTTRPPIIVTLDLNEPHSLSEKVDEILGITGHVDILVNNGGISQRASVMETDLEVDIRIMTINYFGTVALTKAILPHMVKRKQGHVVAISSIQGLVALPFRSAYGASKQAMHSFCDSLRAEVAHHNIHVTVVSPGYVRTSLSRNALTGTGDAHRQMDEATEQGYSPQYVAQKIALAVALKDKEMMIAPLLPRVAVMLRKYLPSLYFYAMERRARK